LSTSWLNGKFTDGSLVLDSFDRGFLLGDGVFETIAVINQKPLWLTEHLQRMELAAAELGIPLDGQALRNGVAAVLKQSQGNFEVLRVTLSRGAAARGLAGDGSVATLLITLDAFAAQNLFRPCRLKVSTIRRNEFAPSSRLKTLSYVDGIMAAREVAADADDALMLNTAGHVASATVANLFVLRRGELITPGLDQGILAGIMRRLLLDNAPKPVERAVHLTDLFAADAVFLSNSLRLIRPVSHINGESLVTGSLDGLKDVLCGLAQRQCGIDPRSLI
jgi:branched-chain amino acid aminotransferase